jgi:PHD/YefM family antitoxin component YafN of YafNO toxin-antitoxin module
MSTAEELHPQFVLDVNGNKKAVLLPIEEYEELLEDLSDLAVAAERKDENTVSHEQLLKEFNTDGSV